MRLEYYLKVRWLFYNSKKAKVVAKSVKDLFEKKQCVFDGKAIPVSLMPLLLNRQEIEKLSHASEVLSSVIEKTVNAIFTSQRIKDYVKYDGVPQKWLDVSPAFKSTCLLNRLDAIFDGENLKFVNFETDFPYGQAWADIVRAEIARHPFYREIVSFPELEADMALQNMLIESIEKHYKKFTTKDKKPTVAFSVYKDFKETSDAFLLADFFNKNGIRSILADPRDFIIKDGNIFVGDRKVELLYRGMKAQRFLNYPKNIENFVNGYMSKSFPVANSFQSVYGSEKSIFAIISNPDFHHLYTKQELEAIVKYIPWTRMLSELETTGPDNKKIDIEDYIKANKDALVLKSSWGSEGKKTFVGVDLDKDVWENALSDYLGRHDWIVQEYVSPPTLPMPTFENQRIYVKKQFFNISSYVVDGKFAQVMGHVSKNRAISIHNKARILPVLQY